MPSHALSLQLQLRHQRSAHPSTTRQSRHDELFIRSLPWQDARRIRTFDPQPLAPLGGGGVMGRGLEANEVAEHAQRLQGL